MDADLIYGLVRMGLLVVQLFVLFVGTGKGRGCDLLLAFAIFLTGVGLGIAKYQITH